MSTLDIRRDGNQIKMSLDVLEHIANCLVNQKYMDQWNADATEDIEGSKNVDKANQAAIDQCWKQMMDTIKPVQEVL